jgi:allantoin racemase
MRKALVINPNTSPSMTAEIEETARRIFGAQVDCRVVCAPAGPESLESWTDYHLAAVSILPLLETHPDVDGVVLACFGDPGLFMLKESLDAPVVGIAEASMSLALLLGSKFGILAGMERAVELMDSMVQTYGLNARYAGTEPLNLRVLAFDRDRAETLAALETASRKLRSRGADVLLLGCAGLTAFVDELQERVSMPVIDPVAAGCRVLQTIWESRLTTSHAGLYARPAPQTMNNLERLYTPEMAAAFRRPRRD